MNGFGLNIGNPVKILLYYTVLVYNNTSTPNFFCILLQYRIVGKPPKSIGSSSLSCIIFIYTPFEDTSQSRKRFTCVYIYI